MMMNPELNFATDLKRRVNEHIQRMVDNALDGIFHGDYTVVARTRLHLSENLINVVEGRRAHRVPKVLERCRLGEGPFRPQKSNLQRLFQGETG